MPAKIGSEFVVNTGNMVDPQTSADIAGRPDGSFVVAWRSEFRPGDEDLDYEIQARAFVFGLPQAGEFRVNIITQDGQFSPAVTASPDGHFAVAYSSGWEDSLPGTSVNTRFLDANGVPTGPEYLTDYNYYHLNPEVAAFADGAVVTIWSDEQDGAGEIRAADGSLLASFDFGYSNLEPKALAVVSDTSFVVAWYGYRDEDDAMAGGDPVFYGQIRQRDGMEGTPFEIGTAAGGRPDPSITRLSNGNFVVVWTDGLFAADPGVDQGADIKARIFTPDGQALGEAFTVNTGLPGDQFNADVAALSNGRFVVVWTDGNGNPELPSLGPLTIDGQIFLANGDRQGDAFQVNATSPINSIEPSVTSLGGDRFAVAWSGDEGQEGLDGGIKVQLFAADGAPAPLTINGGGGNDRLTGGFGDDLISGGAGADTMFGGFGADRLLGDKGEDRLYGGADGDLLIGGWQSDRLYGELGNDVLQGDLTGMAGGSRGANDQLFGGDGDDILYGDAVTIAAGGHGGNDVLSGGDGDDKLYGDGAAGLGVATGGGDDKLEGGWGQDQLWGGGGDDRFVFNGYIGSDIIWDFGQEPGDNDVIDLRGTEAGSSINGPFEIYFIGGNAELHFNGGFIKVMGVTHFDANDILI